MTAYNTGDQVIIKVGDFQGCIGIYQEEAYGMLVLAVPGVLPSGSYVAVLPEDIVPYDDQELEPVSVKEPFPVDMEVPGFGMNGVQLASYFDVFADTVVANLVRTGEKEFSLQGFQNFEGQPLEAVLDQSLMALENSAGQIARAHIVIQRMLGALKETK